jgi:hypothetical protein
VHSHVASLLNGARIELRELNAHFKVILQPKERSKERNPQAERGSFYLHVFMIVLVT